MNRYQAWLVFGLLFVAKVAGASDHGGGHEAGAHEINWFELIGQSFTFLCFVGLLVWKGGPAAKSFFLNRHESVKKAVEEAQRAKADAEAKAAEYTRKMADIEGELQKLKDTFASTAAAEKQRLLQEAEQTAKRIEKDTHALIQTELEKAQAALRADAADMAVKLAEDILRKEIKADDQKRLVNEFMQSLGKSSKQKAA
jgi:F-type H+-transporting ATPase subunit b